MTGGSALIASRLGWFVPLLLLFAGAERAAAGAWTRDQGEGTIRLRYATLGGDRFFDAEGESQRLPSRYRQHSLELYSELGLIDRWLTLSLEGTLYRWNRFGGERSEGVGDLRLGAWSGLLVKPGLRLTAGLLAGIPTGDDSNRINNAPPGVLGNLPNGDGEFDLEGRLVLGSDLPWLRAAEWPLRHFVEVSLGFLYHTDQHEALTWSLKLGAKLPYGVLERVWLIANLRGLSSLGTKRDVEPILTGFGDAVSYVAYGLELSVELVGPLQLFAGVDSAFAARALPRALLLSVGVAANF